MQRLFFLFLFFVLVGAVANGQNVQWQLVSHYPTSETVYDIAYLDESRGFLLAEDGLYTSMDGGSTWAPSNLNFTASLIDLKEETIVIGAFAGSVSFSTDGGEFWNAINPPFCLSKVQVLGQDTIFLIGPEEVLYTTNGGIEWQSDPGPILSSFNCLDGAQYTSFDVGYAILNDALYKKEENSPIWVQIHNADFAQFKSLAFKDDLNGVVCLSNGDVIKTSDGGASWVDAGVPPGSSYEFAEFHPPGNYVLVDESSHIAWSMDAGQSWNTVELEPDYIGDDFRGIGFKGEEIIITGLAGRIYTNQTGEPDDWVRRFSTIWRFNHASVNAAGEVFLIDNRSVIRYDGSVAAFTTYPITDFSVSSIDDFEMISSERGFMITGFGQLWETQNGGASWTEYELGSLDWDDLRDITFLNDQFGFHSQLGLSSVYRTNNGGLTWIPVLSGGITGKLSIANEQVVFAIDDNSENKIFYRSTDGGINWSERGTVNAGNVIDFVFLDENTGYLLTLGQIFKSEDGAITWVELPEPENSIGYRDIEFVSNEVGFLVGGGSGMVFLTEDGGNSWVQSGIENIRVLARNDSHVFAAGDDGLMYAGSISSILRSNVPEKGDDLRVYPNPATDFIVLEYPPGEWNTVDVMDIGGRLLRSSDMAVEGIQRMDVGALAKGLYVLRLKGDGQVRTVKFLVAR